MIISNINPNNKVDAFVELYEGSTLALTCTCADALESFTVGRASESKFFGLDVAQTLKLTLQDFERNIDINSGYTVKVGYAAGADTVFPYPTFYLEEPKRNEQDNTIEVEAFDALYNADKYTLGDLNLGEAYTLNEVANACANVLGCSLRIFEGSESAFSLSYEAGANFDGGETVREIIKALTEATQTICYIAAGDVLTFRRLDKEGEPVITVSQNDYFDFTSGATFTLGGIVSATELGDNIEHITNSEGVKQYIRNNPFLELREDVGAIIEGAAEALDGLSIAAFTCDWIGNCLLEIGDKIAFITNDNNTLTTFNLNSSIVFDGIYNEVSEWEFKEDDAESANNPTSLGEALNKTFARVDKANKEIELLAGEVSGNTTRLSTLEINLDSISTTVASTQEQLETTIEGFNGSISELSTKIEQSAEDIKLSVIEEIQAEGASKITTETGFTFDNEGLTVEQEGAGVKTIITTDGMSVIVDGYTEVLTANSEGVSAKDLHARTYLLIGETSRFEDYEKNGKARTGCFWMGG
jgi:hypothetical protein